MKRVFAMLLAACLVLTGCSIPAKEAAPTTQETTVPVATTEPTVPETTEPPTEPAPTADPNGIVYRAVEPYSLGVSNDKKDIYDAPKGKYVKDFKKIGYYTIDEEAVEPNGTVWGHLSNGAGWTKINSQKFPAISMTFCSGVGAWATTLKIKADGSFSGSFHDSDMGDTGPKYPDGTCYVCDFTGKFKVTKIGTYSVTLKKTTLKRKKKVGKTWIKDGILYIAEDAYGLDGGTTFTLYFPNTPVKKLPKGMRGWGYDIPKSGTLKCYALYCAKTGTAFFSE